MKKLFTGNIWSILIFITILISFFIITYTLRYDVLTDHDLAYPFGRKFLEPEHGRYIATYTNFLLTDVLPEYLNFHPNDFQIAFINPLKAFCTVLIFIFLSCTPFIFSFSKNKANISNPAFILCYILIFVSIYNSLYSVWSADFFNITENTVFWEYPMSLFLYISFWSLIAYYYIKNTPPPHET